MTYWKAKKVELKEVYGTTIVEEGKNNFQQNCMTWFEAMEGRSASGTLVDITTPLGHSRKQSERVTFTFMYLKYLIC